MLTEMRASKSNSPSTVRKRVMNVVWKLTYLPRGSRGARDGERSDVRVAVRGGSEGWQ
jgi:hypothetical protein